MTVATVRMAGGPLDGEMWQVDRQLVVEVPDEQVSSSEGVLVHRYVKAATDRFDYTGCRWV